jgi:hypothetical protein
LDYGAQLGRDDLAISSFAAMAIARDGKNLFTESRLEEIRARMEAAEGTTVCGLKWVCNFARSIVVNCW